MILHFMESTHHWHKCVCCISKWDKAKQLPREWSRARDIYAAVATSSSPSVRYENAVSSVVGFKKYTVGAKIYASTDWVQKLSKKVSLCKAKSLHFLFPFTLVIKYNH